jgi:hypothetical protein
MWANEIIIYFTRFEQNLTVKTAFEIGNILTVIRLSNSVFNSFVNPVITTEEELVNITLSFDD